MIKGDYSGNRDYDSGRNILEDEGAENILRTLYLDAEFSKSLERAADDFGNARGTVRMVGERPSIVSS